MGKNKFIILFLLIILQINFVELQGGTEDSVFFGTALVKSDYRDVFVQENKDTVIITRVPGDIWVGPYMNVTGILNFGKLNFPNYIIKGVDSYNEFINYKGGSGFPGIDIGLIFEWQNPKKDWGLGSKISIYDYYRNESKVSINDTFNTVYSSKTYFTYLSFQPYSRLDFPKLNGTFWEGVYGYGGLTFEIPIKSYTEQTKGFDVPEVDKNGNYVRGEHIEELSKWNNQNQYFRVGLYLGIGWDLFNANIKKLARTTFSPYFEISAGSTMLGDFGSSLNGVAFKLGIAIKIGSDNIQYDTLKFDAEANNPIEALLNFKGKPVSFPGFKEQNFIAANLEYVPPVIINKIVPDTVEIAKTEVKTVQNTKPLPQSKQKIEFNKKYVYGFPNSSTDYELTPEAKEFLKQAAAFLKANPGAVIIIEGHSDGTGSIQQNNARSLYRAKNAANQLVEFGIDSKRIRTSGKGNLSPIGDDRTEAGRRKNRRVEIILQK